MNKKNWLVIGAIILVALGVWFYFDSREDVGLGPEIEEEYVCFVQCLDGVRYWFYSTSVGCDDAACSEVCRGHGGLPGFNFKECGLGKIGQFSEKP